MGLIFIHSNSYFLILTFQRAILTDISYSKLITQRMFSPTSHVHPGFISYDARVHLIRSNIVPSSIPTRCIPRLIKKMEYIDVFSGIGGIGYALAPFVKPILYCEVDKYCQQVLTERMRDGHIDKAPIHADIKSLYISPHMKPKMIGGGFPCQDISTAGAQIGMAGTRSSLFFEIMRLVDTTPSITHVFLENVANIVKCGMQEVVDELKARNFDIVWTTRSAASLGAPHQRSRWFCLAVKHDDNPVALQDTPTTTVATEVCSATTTGVPTSQINPWANEWPTRVTFKNNPQDPSWDPNWISRSHCLGNTVVPCVVRSAFVELMGIASRLKLIKEAMTPYATSCETLAYPFPESGIISQGTFIPLPSHKQVNPNPSNIDITVVSTTDNKTFKMGNYPTLRRGITHPSNVTERSMHDLPTVLCNTTLSHAHIATVFKDGIPDRLQGHIVPNVNYLEWMMGYPPDWTKVTSYVRERSGGTSLNNSNNKASDDADIPRDQPMKNKNNPRPKNCMHLFMKDSPGKDVRQVAIMWRELSQDKKNEYRQRAKNMA